MTPAFGLVEAKALLPYFMSAVTRAYGLRFRWTLKLKVDSGSHHKMADKRSDIIENRDGKSGRSAIIDVSPRLGCTENCTVARGVFI